MVKDGIWVAAGGLRQSAETGNARAETLGPDGGQQTWKPGPGGAAGLTDAKESTQNLFRMKMAGPGGRAGAGLETWAPRLASRAGERCARHGRLWEQPGEQAGKGPSSTTAWHKTTAENKSTRLDRGQDNGDLGDMSQQHGTTLDTVLAIFNRLRYYMENGAKTNTQSGAVDTKNELKASTQSH